MHRLRGAVDKGKIVAWSNTIVGQSFLKGSPFEAVLIKDGIDQTSVEGSKEIPYEVADFRCELHTTDVGVPTVWWRSVGHTHTGYAVECFVDELLQAAGKDPVAGRLEMMGKAPRHAGVLRAVAELAKWSGPGPVNGRARGVAVVESFNSYVAQIAEVSAGEGGEPRVHKVWCAVDCGVAVNPDVIRAQMEGGIGYGLGHMLFGEITLEGRPAGAGEFRQLPVAAHPRNAAGRSHDRALDRKADRCRRARRAADRARGRERHGAARAWPSAPAAGRAGDGVTMNTRLIATALLSSAIVVGAAFIVTDQSAGQPRAPRSRHRCGQPSSFDGIKNQRARSVALFQEAGKVIQHPRCVNCHPAGDRPTQTDRMRPHQPLVVRGADGHGRAGNGLHDLPSRDEFRCREVAGPSRTGISPRPRWLGRAARSARFARRSRTRSATAARTWRRSFTTWLRIRWSVGAGRPGQGRTPAPGTQAEFGALIKAWAASGAHCPS